MPADRSSQSAPKRTRSAHAESDPCEICGQILSRNSDMPRHLKTHSASAKLACNFPGCSFSTVQKSGLETHQRRHTSQKIFKCIDDATCKFSTCDAASLLRHRKKMHNYVPRATSSRKKISAEPKDQTHRNPHRIPVSVIRSVRDDSNSTAEVFAQFSSFASGAPSTSASAPASGNSSPLSELSESTSSDGDSESMPSTPEAPHTPFSTSSVESSYPQPYPTTVNFMRTPHVYFPQDFYISYYSGKPLKSALFPSDWACHSAELMGAGVGQYTYTEQLCGTTEPSTASSSLFHDMLASNGVIPEHKPPYVQNADPGHLATGFNEDKRPKSTDMNDGSFIKPSLSHPSSLSSLPTLQANSQDYYTLKQENLQPVRASTVPELKPDVWQGIFPEVTQTSNVNNLMRVADVDLDLSAYPDVIESPPQFEAFTPAW